MMAERIALFAVAVRLVSRARLVSDRETAELRDGIGRKSRGRRNLTDGRCMAERPLQSSAGAALECGLRAGVAREWIEPAKLSGDGRYSNFEFRSEFDHQ